MKRILLTLMMIIPLLMAANTRPRVALVLGGGGAKGMAHVGVLKVLEKAGVPVDMICGTSIGSLVGGLYAMGYSADQLDTLVRSQDWDFLLSDRISQKQMNVSDRELKDQYLYTVPLSKFSKGAFTQQALVKGQNLANLFIKLSMGYHDSIDFSTLPIPFACVATDMVKFQEVDIHSGHVAQAMRASMSIPAMFTPVRIDSMVLVDGGLRNNFPVDVAKKMGADYIIGVNLNQVKDNTLSDFDSPTAVLTQIVKVHTENKFHENWALCTIPIQVNDTGYNSMSFNPAAVDSLIARGVQAGMAHWDEFMQLKQQLGLEPTATGDGGSIPVLAKAPRKRSLHDLSAPMLVSDVKFEGMQPAEQNYLEKKYHLQPGQKITVSQIEQGIGTLRSQFYYNDAHYQLLDHGNGSQLVVTTEGKKASQIYLGARFDNEELAALQVESIFPNLGNVLHVPYSVQVAGRLGKRMMGKLQANVTPSSHFAFSLGYTYRYNDIDCNRKGRRSYDLTYDHHQVELSFKNFTASNFLFDLFARYTYINYRNVMSRQAGLADSISNNRFVSYHARLHFNNEDNTYFTTRGTKLELQYALYTDNFHSYKGHSAISVARGVWRTTAPVAGSVVLQPSIYARFVFDTKAPFILGNYVGGMWASHYLEQQMPFPGIARIEKASNAFLSFQMPVRLQVTTNNFVALVLGVAEHSQKFKDLFDHTPFFGAEARYAYRTIVGPVGASLGWSSLTHRVSYYINLGFEF